MKTPRKTPSICAVTAFSFCLTLGAHAAGNGAGSNSPAGQHSQQELGSANSDAQAEFGARNRADDSAAGTRGRDIQESHRDLGSVRGNSGNQEQPEFGSPNRDAEIRVHGESSDNTGRTWESQNDSLDSSAQRDLGTNRNADTGANATNRLPTQSDRGMSTRNDSWGSQEQTEYGSSDRDSEVQVQEDQAEETDGALSSGLESSESQEFGSSGRETGIEAETEASTGTESGSVGSQDQNEFGSPQRTGDADAGVNVDVSERQNEDAGLEQQDETNRDLDWGTSGNEETEFGSSMREDENENGQEESASDVMQRRNQSSNEREFGNSNRTSDGGMSIGGRTPQLGGQGQNSSGNTSGSGQINNPSSSGNNSGSSNSGGNSSSGGSSGSSGSSSGGSGS